MISAILQTISIIFVWRTLLTIDYWWALLHIDFWQYCRSTTANSCPTTSPPSPTRWAIGTWTRPRTTSSGSSKSKNDVTNFLGFVCFLYGLIHKWRHSVFENVWHPLPHWSRFLVLRLQWCCHKIYEIPSLLGLWCHLRKNPNIFLNDFT